MDKGQQLKLLSLVGIPVAFVAGIAFLLLVQQFGLFGFAPPGFAENQTDQVGTSAETGSAAATQLSTSNHDLDAASAAKINSVAEQNSLTTPDTSVLKEFSDGSIAVQNEIEFLREEIELAREERKALISDLEALQLSREDQSSGIDSIAAGEIPTTEFGNRPRIFGRNGFGGTGQLQENLIAAGIDETRASDIKRRQDAHELSRLELIDKAAREGWRGTERFTTELEELQNGRIDLQDELGDESFDEFLFSSGQFNRVSVASVLEGSAAQLAGMQLGDVIWSYAEVRTYTIVQLQELTREGNSGELVPVLVRRSNQFIPLQLARGPMGVTLTGSSEDPGLSN